MIDLYLPIHELFNSQKRYSFPYDENEICEITELNGLYILFEKGETYHEFDRIVRVGSHKGKNRLTKRLKDHFSGYNQRKSIFRKHIGRCFLSIENDKYIENWNKPFKKRTDKERYKEAVDLGYEHKYEELISEYITLNLSFSVLPKIKDRFERDEIEKGLIASLAQSSSRTSSDDWLGNNHPDISIQRAKIWNIQHLNDQPLSQRKFQELKNHLTT